MGLWNQRELEFLTEHPEVFENAEFPWEIVDSAIKFTKYHLEHNSAVKMALAWAEVKGQWSLALHTRSSSSMDRKVDLFLTNGLSKYSIGSFLGYSGDSQEDLIRRIKILFSLTLGISNPDKVIPKLWSGLMKVILR
jgi:hypothetical protein